MSSSLQRRRVDGALLGRLLDDPDLAPTLQALPATALRQVILEVGLEDSGELIALASVEQLREMFDEDLWRSATPGEDEEFDATRFDIWLEVLLEGGEQLAADRFAELSEDFLVFAVSQLVRVLDLAILTTWAADPREADRLDRIVDTHFSHELDEFLLLSRRERGWDTVLNTLLALDERHSELLRGVLDRCASASHEALQSADMLFEAIDGDERLLEDARAEREARRAERGYVAPADARAFLGLARTPPEAPERDPITRAHFRERNSRAETGAGPALAAGSSRAAPLRQLLLEAGADPVQAEVSPTTSRGLLRDTLAELFEADPTAHQRIVDEIAYLANVLIAGDTSREQAWRPVEAADRVLDLCDEGLRSVVARDRAEPHTPCEALLHWGAVGVFRIAWSSQSGGG